MILGIPASTFIAFHVFISVIGIVSGLIMLLRMINSRLPGLFTATFLVATVVTSVTGFPIPPFGFDPPRAVGAISLVLLAVAIPAIYVYRLTGAWRWIYIVTATAALYLNSFVFVVQAFQKVPALNALAPTQSEPPFAVAQIAVLVFYAALGYFAVKRFHP
jgi:hypothetical protein